MLKEIFVEELLNFVYNLTLRYHFLLLSICKKEVDILCFNLFSGTHPR